MSVAIRCGTKVNGVRQESHSQCRPPVYNEKQHLVKGCPLWNECIKELNDKSIEVSEEYATQEEIDKNLAFQDINGDWKIFRKV